MLLAVWKEKRYLKARKIGIKGLFKQKFCVAAEEGVGSNKSSWVLPQTKQAGICLFRNLIPQQSGEGQQWDGLYLLLHTGAVCSPHQIKHRACTCLGLPSPANMYWKENRYTMFPTSINVPLLYVPLRKCCQFQLLRCHRWWARVDFREVKNMKGVYVLISKIWC